jgi:hypothetical protein
MLATDSWLRLLAFLPAALHFLSPEQKALPGTPDPTTKIAGRLFALKAAKIGQGRSRTGYLTLS